MSKGRPRVPYLRVDFKVSLPAALAAEIDLTFNDPLTNRPKYGARAKLIQALLENWLATQRGGEQGHVPTLEELRDHA
jgi:metal-responsive CopG/Arc/MetJ family transcriptional regulator